MLPHPLYPWAAALPGLCVRLRRLLLINGLAQAEALVVSHAPLCATLCSRPGCGPALAAWSCAS